MRYGFWCGVVAAASLVSVSQAVDTLNLDGVRTTLATKSASGQAHVMIFGDSLSVRQGSYAPYLQAALQNHYGNAGLGYTSISGGSTAGFYSGEWYAGIGGGDGAPYNALNGLWTQGNSGYGYFDASAPQVGVQYLGVPGGGSVELYQQDSQGAILPLQTISTNSASNAVKTLNLNLPANNLRVYMHPLGNGPVTLLGMDALSTAPGVRMSVAANGGWTTQNFLNRNWTFDGSLQIENPDVALIFLGQNDQALFTAAQFKANLLAMASRIQTDRPGIQICLVSPYGGTSGLLGEYTAAEAALAAEQGYGFINLGALGGGYQYYVDHNLLDDGIHFSPAGGQYVAGLLFNALSGAGTAVPEPASLGALAVGMVVLLSRRRVRA